MEAVLERRELFETLPLWGQALLAARMARRGILAMLDHAPGSGIEAALLACDALEECARAGQGWHDRHATFDAAMLALRKPESLAALHALRWAIDAAGAAEGAWDFPVDGTVTVSAKRSFAALVNDPRVSALQIATLVAADADLIAFACAEAKVGTYDALTPQVFGRLTPVHPISLATPATTPREQTR